MKKTLCAALLCVAALTVSGCKHDRTANSGRGAAASVPNPAMSQPDEVAWSIFAKAVAPSGGKGTTFETWPSDHDTFTPGAKPIDPAAARTVGEDQLDLKPPVIPSARSGDLAALSPKPAGHSGLQAATVTTTAATTATAAGLDPPVPSPAPPGLNPGGANDNGCNAGASPQTYEPACDPGISEEVRRNVPAYNYIVNNQLNSRSGLIKAYNSNFYVNFPVDSVEVKMNWLPAELLPTYYPGIPKEHFYIATDMVPNPNDPSKPSGKAYALIAMHVISKEVPNWTWATFEHHGNRGRCDFLGCSDDFGSETHYVPPVTDDQGNNQGTVYAACTPTAALKAMFKSAGVGDVFLNYCLKGSQTDFTNATGLAVRVGNSVTENGFVTQASCMTCHGMANISPQGQPTTTAGFINGNAQIGPVDPSLYWSAAGGQPAYYLGQPGLTRTSIAADFVWSIPFCAYDDVTDPSKPALHCQSK